MSFGGRVYCEIAIFGELVDGLHEKKSIGCIPPVYLLFFFNTTLTYQKRKKKKKRAVIIWSISILLNTLWTDSRYPLTKLKIMEQFVFVATLENIDDGCCCIAFLEIKGKFFFRVQIL